MLTKTQEQINLKEFKEKVINDYRTVSLSREISVMGRRDVLSGKGKFGIFSLQTPSRAKPNRRAMISRNRSRVGC